MGIGFQKRTGTMVTGDNLLKIDEKAFVRGSSRVAKQLRWLMNQAKDLRGPFSELTDYMVTRQEQVFKDQKFGNKDWENLGASYFYIRYSLAARNPAKFKYPTHKRGGAQRDARVVYPKTLQMMYPNLVTGPHINIMDRTGELRNSFIPGQPLNVNIIKKQTWVYGTKKQLWYQTRDKLGDRINVRNIKGRPRKVIGIRAEDRKFFLGRLQSHFGEGGK